ncbi:D-amino acid dehydrogenase small subunit DadA (plasmid) [Sinorhizobium americanum CCGM7]|uniref:NAD(P)/FAD-dependent oxidoreductase n=1 Tax=Sinorhizobium americanum TaxID=194963 RepID=UPI0004D55CE3|nr:FAD-binding oxidoreductase [Sinorhizobium americanum]APG87835.1 D-amino acid dehydrogenase small subunit DadA [Sinorhizobium americanum CCGM7]
MSPIVKRIQNDQELPAKADAVVIGGGIVGATAAFFLAERGLSVALVEKGHVGCEQSSRNWGWCRRQNRDARELPLSGVALRLWGEFQSKIGEDVGFRRCGLLYATDNPRQLAEWEAWRDTARPFDVNTRMLSAREAAAAIPANGRRWLGGVHSIDDGKGEPAIAAPTIANGARKFGATIHQECAARGLDLVNGAVAGVITEKGLIRTQAVLCAGGAWTSMFCRQFGVLFPQASVRQTALRTRPTADLGEAIYTPECALTRRLDGSYTLAISGRATLDITPQGIRYARWFMPMFLARLKAIQIGVGKSMFRGPEALASWNKNTQSPFERMRVLDPTPSRRTIAAILKGVTEQFPALAGVEVADSWGAYVDCTPDAVPVISPADGVKGLYLAAGGSGHGFGLGPGIGRLAADLVTNDAPCVDPSPFRLSRFVDGSKVKVGAI